MTVFSGRSAVELQRGWIINLGGTKMNITLDQTVRNGPLKITFDGRNLRVKLDSSSKYLISFVYEKSQALSISIYQKLESSYGWLPGSYG